MIFLPFQPVQESVFTDNTRLELVKIVHSYNQPGWMLPSHSHPDQTEILYIAGGKGIYTADNTPYHVQSGDIVIFNRNVVHSVESDDQAPLDVWSCAVRGYQLPGLTPNHILPAGSSPVLTTGERHAVFEAIYREIYYQGKQQDKGYYSICTALVTALVLLCIQLSEEQQKYQTKEKDSLAADVLLYLDEHFSEPVTMESLSRHFHVSASHLSHEVNSAFHLSPISYLIGRRIRQAQWELVSTDFSLKEIALHVGYENANHFSNLFYKRTGMKPLEFRQHYTEQKKTT